VEIGIGLPITLPGTTGEQVVEWARRSDQAGFSSLGTLDRLVYSNYEPLVALGAAAAVTQRARLLTSVLLLPWRQNAALVAKQAASVHALSNGGLVLGVAVGSRPDDFEASAVPMEGRGKRIEEMLDEIKRIWAGEERGHAGPIGPDVSDSPPSIMLGGAVDAAFHRAARYGDGWIMGTLPAEALPEGRAKVEAAFREAGRTEKPRVIALSYYSLDENPEDQVRRTIGHYYSFAPEYRETVVQGAAKGEDEVRERVRAFEEVGCDELVLLPASANADQVDKLAALVL
jgi:alkanesulfonate monooxygenase SsuD/methylene tetrahydromethanopterin reductase-like flavin-dependent oxidoreductase (luciferase family)